jgi:hypothetical protein
VLNRALAIDRSARYPDAESFATALRQVAIDHHLLYSAPELAAELREIMGPDPDHWLSDQRDPTHQRNARAGQAPGVPAGHEVDSVVEPGPAARTGDDLNIEDEATPPAQRSGSLPVPSAWASGQLAVATGRSSGQMPALADRASGERPALTGRSSAQMPVASGRLSGQLAAVASPISEEDQVTPPPPVPLPPVASMQNQIAPPQRGPSDFQPVRPVGGVAALKRSRRRLWLFILLVLAVLLGFVFVRFVIAPVALRSSATADRLAQLPAVSSRVVPWRA